MKMEFRAEKSLLLGLLACGLLAGLSAAEATAQQAQTYQENGMLYRDHVTRVQRPIATIKTEERRQLVHRMQVTTEMRDTYRNYATPVTNYQWVTKEHGRWNPFVQPYYSQKMVPITRWEPRTEVTQVPITRTTWVPEIQTRQVQVPSWRMTEEKVVRKVYVGIAPTTTTRTASRPAASVARIPNSTTSLKGEPPRWGSRGTVGGAGTTRVR